MALNQTASRRSIAGLSPGGEQGHGITRVTDPEPWALVFDDLRHPVGIATAENRLTYANPAFTQHYGCRASSPAAAPWPFWLPPPSDPTLRRRCQQQLSRGTPLTGIREVTTSAGRHVAAFVSIVPLRPAPAPTPCGYLYASSAPAAADVMQAELAQALLSSALTLSSHLTAPSSLPVDSSPGSRQRAILRLTDLGYPAKRVAGMLNITEGTVRNVIWRHHNLQRAARRPEA